MTELQYRAVVWLTYRLGATFAIGLPLVLIIWASLSKEASIFRLLSIYWKITSLIGIGIMLLVGGKAIGYLILTLAPILMISSLWFWVDLNEELADLPPWRALPLTTRIWRWALTGFGVINIIISSTSFNCINGFTNNKCFYWLEIPNIIHSTTSNVFGFLFGANWNESISGFFGYLFLIIYISTFIQWLLIRLPRQGRIAGNF